MSKMDVCHLPHLATSADCGHLCAVVSLQRFLLR